jgi:hypothetical protein
MKTLTQKFAGIGLGICLVIGNYVNAQTLTAKGTCNSIPSFGTLKPIQVVMDANNLSGFGMGNAEDPSLAPNDPTKYFVAGRGTAPALFAPVINWVNKYSIDVPIGCRRAVREANNYYVLYHEYDLTTATLPTEARISRLDVTNGNVLNSVKLDFSSSGLTNVYAWDMVHNSNYLFVLCRGNNGTDDTPVLSIIDINTLAVIDNVVIPVAANYLADGLTMDSNGNLYVIGRVNNSSGSTLYDQIAISAFAVGGPPVSLSLIDQQIYDIGSVSNISTLTHSAIKYNPFSGYLVVACQSIDPSNTIGDLHLWNLKPGLVFVNIETYTNNSRLFNSNINIDKKSISLAGPNNINSLSSGNVVAQFNHACGFAIMREFPFTGSSSEEHIIAGNTAANYFIMAAELFGFGNQNKVHYAVNLNFNTACGVTTPKLVSNPIAPIVTNSFSYINFLGFSKISKLSYVADGFSSTDRCSLKGRAASSGSFTEVIDNNQELNWNFKQAQDQINLTATNIISDLKVVNLQGQIFNFSSNDTEVNFNTEKLFPGIYIASFMVNGELQTKKFIVNR